MRELTKYAISFVGVIVAGLLMLKHYFGYKHGHVTCSIETYSGLGLPCRFRSTYCVVDDFAMQRRDYRAAKVSWTFEVWLLCLSRVSHLHASGFESGQEIPTTPLCSTAT